MAENKKQGVKVLSEFMGFSKPFMSSWDALIQVVERLESLDLSEQMYKWEDSRGMNYNFQCIEVMIERNTCWITINLELDPPIWLNSEWTKKQNSLELDYRDSKKDAVFYSCVEAVEYLKENKLV